MNWITGLKVLGVMLEQVYEFAKAVNKAREENRKLNPDEMAAFQKRDDIIKDALQAEIDAQVEEEG